MAQLVDVLIDQQIFLYVGIGGRNIGFRLVVIVVAHKIFDRIVGKQPFEFAIKLGSEGLVVTEHQRGHIGMRNQMRHGEGFPGSRGTEQPGGPTPDPDLHTTIQWLGADPLQV